MAAINANAAGDKAQDWREIDVLKKLSIDYPILLNETGQLGRLLARPARQNFVFDAKGNLVYRGGLDSTGGRKTLGENVTHWLENALTEHFKHECPFADQALGLLDQIN